MYRVEHRTGRLVEIAIWSPVSIDEVDRWGADHNAVIAGIGGPYICFVDLRGASVFPKEVVDAYVGVMKEEPGLLRTATLLPDKPMVAMQIRRMIREAGHPERQPFEEADALMQWLGPHLSPMEKARMTTLLRAAPGESSPRPVPMSSRPYST